MTIEERAKGYADAKSAHLGGETKRVVWEKAYADYMYIASVQKAVDDIFMAKLKEAWEKEAEINHDAAAHYEQGWHDAVEWACEWFKNNYRMCVLGGEDMIDSFRKHMEESN